MKKELIQKLKSIQRYDLYGYSNEEYGPGIDQDKSEDGNWVKYEDIEKLIKELEENDK